MTTDNVFEELLMKTEKRYIYHEVPVVSSTAPQERRAILRTRHKKHFIYDTFYRKSLV